MRFLSWRIDRKMRRRKVEDVSHMRRVNTCMGWRRYTFDLWASIHIYNIDHVQLVHTQ